MLTKDKDRNIIMTQEACVLLRQDLPLMLIGWSVLTLVSSIGLSFKELKINY